MTTRLFAPSYNRPLQLYALLESIKLYDKSNVFDKIEIYYGYTTDDLKAGMISLILQ
jgi:hypothetical protein